MSVPFEDVTKKSYFDIKYEFVWDESGSDDGESAQETGELDVIPSYPKTASVNYNQSETNFKADQSDSVDERFTEKCDETSLDDQFIHATTNNQADLKVPNEGDAESVSTPDYLRKEDPTYYGHPSTTFSGSLQQKPTFRRAIPSTCPPPIAINAAGFAPGYFENQYRAPQRRYSRKPYKTRNLRKAAPSGRTTHETTAVNGISDNGNAAIKPINKIPTHEESAIEPALLSQPESHQNNSNGGFLHSKKSRKSQKTNRSSSRYPVSVNHGQPTAYLETPVEGYAAPENAPNNTNYSAPVPYDHRPVSQFTGYHPQNAYPINQLGYSAPPQQFYDLTHLQNQGQFLHKGYYHNGVWYPPPYYQQQHQMNFIANHVAHAEYNQPQLQTGQIDKIPSNEYYSSASARDGMSDTNLLGGQSESVSKKSDVEDGGDQLRSQIGHHVTVEHAKISADSAKSDIIGENLPELHAPLSALLLTPPPGLSNENYEYNRSNNAEGSSKSDERVGNLVDEVMDGVVETPILNPQKAVNPAEKKEVAVQTTEMFITFLSNAELASTGVQSAVKSQLSSVPGKTEEKLKSNPKMHPNSATLGQSSSASDNSVKTTAMNVDSMKTVATSDKQTSNVGGKSTSHSVGPPPVKLVESSISHYMGPSSIDFPPLSEVDPTVALSRAAKNRFKEAVRREASSNHYALILSNRSQGTTARVSNSQAGLRSANENPNLPVSRQSQKPSISFPSGKRNTTKKDVIQKTSNIPRNMLLSKEVQLSARIKTSSASPKSGPLAKIVENKASENSAAGRLAAKASNLPSLSSNASKQDFQKSYESDKLEAKLPSKKKQTLAAQVGKNARSTNDFSAETEKNGTNPTGSAVTSSSGLKTAILRSPSSDVAKRAQADLSDELKQKLSSRKKEDSAAQTKKDSTPVDDSLPKDSENRSKNTGSNTVNAAATKKPLSTAKATKKSMKPSSSSSKSKNRLKTKQKPQIGVNSEADDEHNSSTKQLSKSQKKKEKKKRSDAWKKENALFIDFFANFNDEILLNDVRKARDDMNAYRKRKRLEAGKEEEGFLDAIVDVALYEHFLILVKDPFTAFHTSGNIPDVYKEERTGLGRRILEHCSRAMLVDWNSKRSDFEDFVINRVIYHESKHPSPQRKKLIYMFEALLYRKSLNLVEDLHLLTTLDLDDKEQERLDFQYLSLISYGVSPKVQAGLADNWPTVTSIREKVETELTDGCLQHFCDYIRRQFKCRHYGLEFDAKTDPEVECFNLFLVAHSEGSETFEDDEDGCMFSNLLKGLAEKKDPYYNQCSPYLEFLCKIRSTLIRSDVYLLFIIGNVELLEGVRMGLWAWFNKRVSY